MHDHAQPRVEQIAITESGHDRPVETHDVTVDEGAVGTAAGFASEPHEGREEPRRDERRRRRGRRGGRRNRQRNGEGGYADQSGRYTQQEFAPAEQLIAPAAAEPALSHAVTDLDSSPTERAASPDVSPDVLPDVPSATVGQSEAARRSSTVREPVPTGGGEVAGNEPAAPTASPAPEPVITETGHASEGERPRRTGWWSRRFAGS
jgi:ribonuclease E